MTEFVLLCDIAMGDSVDMSLARPGTRPPPATPYACPNRAAFDDAVMDFLSQNGSPPLKGAAISSRGWETNGVVLLPEDGITFARDDIRKLVGVQRVNLVNNFVARALAIPRLERDESVKVCGDDPHEDQVIAVLGPHQGLGVAALAPDGMGNWTAIPCEGGHSDLPVTTEREWRVREVMARCHGHVGREFAISLEGLAEVWHALCVIDGDEVTAKTPEEIIALATIGDARGTEAVSLTLGWLAAMASDVGLILGARGGIYLTGDLMDLIGDLFDPEAFCQRYTDKGRLSNFVSEIPVYKTLAKELEIIGLATLFD